MPCSAAVIAAAEERTPDDRSLLHSKLGSQNINLQRDEDVLKEGWTIE